MRIVVDMNLSPTWALVLYDYGFEVQHWSKLGTAEAEDRTIFDHARSHDAVILTQDLDFSAILAQTNLSKPSVVLLRLPDVDPMRTSGLVVAALHTCASALAAGAILTIDENRRRVRLLPLHPDSSDT
jgi:predicted nuclease of predicted toxin-antitoxin system